jgi:hypothetical protein
VDVHRLAALGMPSPEEPSALPRSYLRSLWENFALFAFTELFSFPFCFEGATEGVMRGHWWVAAQGYGIGIPFAILGFAFPLFQGPKVAAVRRWFKNDGWKWWVPIVAVSLFCYVLGPAVYRRATESAMLGPSAQEIAAAIAPILKSATEGIKQALVSGVQPPLAPPATPTANEIAAAIAPFIKSELSNIKPTAPQASGVVTSPLPKSPIFGLDDGAKWRFVKTWHDIVLSRQNMPLKCAARVGIELGKQRALDTFGELMELFHYTDWDVRQVVAPPVQAAGITFLIGTDSGDALLCATKFSQMLQNLSSVPVAVRVNQVTEPLLGCKNECVEIEIGGRP